MPPQGEAYEPKAAAEGHYVLSPAVSERFIREPENTWSNLSYIITGTITFSIAVTFLGRSIGMATMGVGVASFLYHASSARMVRNWDVGAMDFLCVLLLVRCAGIFVPSLSRRIQDDRFAILAGSIVLAAFLAIERNAPIGPIKPFALTYFTSFTVLVVLAALAVIASRDSASKISRSAYFVVGWLFALGSAFQTGDHPGNWLFHPGATIQAHALWHIGSALAVGWAAWILDRADRPNIAA